MEIRQDIAIREVIKAYIMSYAIGLIGNGNQLTEEMFANLIKNYSEKNSGRIQQIVFSMVQSIDPKSISKVIEEEVSTCINNFSKSFSYQ